MESDKLEIKAPRNKIKAIVAGITLILNFIDENLPPPPVGDLDEDSLPPDPFVERCRAS